jgi:predicted PurR-regulated permease PerM
MSLQRWLVGQLLAMLALAVHLPPGLTLASLILFGAVFGVASVAVATPLVAAIRQAVLRLRQFSSDAVMDEIEQLP